MCSLELYHNSTDESAVQAHELYHLHGWAKVGKQTCRFLQSQLSKCYSLLPAVNVPGVLKIACQ
ncbi:hypothetical protein CROQUDRAFT_40797 [Cronartium quercuum f. sp. fusiforme G11]|uniref:Uncharacterized protein n=1 Tax=Cronartium quercuum f. sp. fusiforme G11 TaxID=708437 RepID=A0A9P6NSK4_9BASI|nr:hypothetical protein CROQUDRAFT_40797 [Cronartium quercuum f. sp. fusiforme G11]